MGKRSKRKSHGYTPYIMRLLTDKVPPTEVNGQYTKEPGKYELRKMIKLRQFNYFKDQAVTSPVR